MRLNRVIHRLPKPLVPELEHLLVLLGMYVKVVSIGLSHCSKAINGLGSPLANWYSYSFQKGLV